jgi:tetratricopeptide (TPR) repeat protein
LLAKLHVSEGKRHEAKEMLRHSLDEAAPRADALALLARLAEEDEQLNEAERLYRLGAEKFPHATRWLESLSRIYLESSEPRKLRDVLARLAEIESDDFAVRKKLLELSLEADDLGDAVRWGTEAYRIDVMDAEVHAMLGDAFSRKQQFGRAVGELETAVELTPGRADWQVALAENYLHAGSRQHAIEILNKTLSENPDHQRARTLLDKVLPRPKS